MDLVQCSKQLIYKDSFYGHVALGLQKEFSDKIPTACAALEGINTNLYFNEAFFNKQNDKQKVGLMQHELGHVCLFHLQHMREYDDAELFNIAADMVINQYIEADYLPDNAFVPSVFPELNLAPFKDTKYYYEAMRKDLKSQGGEGKSGKLGKIHDHMTGGGMTIASHPLWGKDKDGNEIPQSIMDLAKSQIEHQLKEVYEEALQRNAGALPGYMREFILNLYIKSPPVVDWKAVVRNFNSFCHKVKTKKTYKKFNDRFPDNPAIKIQRQKKMMVAIDTSGSIGTRELDLFFDQIYHINRTGTMVEVIECDAAIGQRYFFKDKSKLPKISGGGGTDFNPVLELFRKERDYNGLIFFTDGYPCGPQTVTINKPIIWVIIPNGTVDFAYSGKKIKMV